ncbi:MAG: hypothetical protein DRJ55_00935 [Thermoprotei archaeon]|nr:MAG: hypothetical protein DRJ55_00935 [Thermoprotei archaeon]
MPPVLEAKNLVKWFSGDGEAVYALRGVNLRVEQGQIVALLGPNGSGKSTFMKITVGVLTPTEGEVRVFGKEPYKDVEVRGRLSYMPQDAGLYQSLTGFENYMFYASIQGVRREKALKMLEELKDDVGLGRWFYKRRVSTYSGGMKRKTSLAVALASNPEFMVLDEPTTGLDPASRRNLWKILEVLQSRGKTILLATHLFDDAEYLADNIVVMYKGKVVASAPPKDLKRKAGYGYAVDVDFAEEPSREVVERLKLPGCRVIPSGGFRVTVVGNSPGLMGEVEERLAGVKVLAVRMRKISLGDVYFLLTGVSLE